MKPEETGKEKKKGLNEIERDLQRKGDHNGD
jgi:hypothetical protein